MTALPRDACFLLLALELKPGTIAGRLALAQDEAARLCALIALDLAAWATRAAELDLVVLGAHFDPSEILRPGWPLHRELELLGKRAPGVTGSRLIAFGAAGQALPAALAPDEHAVGGALRLLPLLLRGDEAAVASVREAFEDVLMQTGMAGAATALLAQQGFDARVEHARYLTLHDLLAMMAMQIEYAGAAPLWPLLEAALLAPQSEAWLDAPPEPLARYHDGAVRMALLDDEAWRAAGFAPAQASNVGQMERAFEQFQSRQRQYAALLEAHGVAVTFDHCPAGTDPREVLRA